MIQVLFKFFKMKLKSIYSIKYNNIIADIKTNTTETRYQCPQLAIKTTSFYSIFLTSE
ncbi:hypothetical protein [Methanobrevibacter arboriphilus]|uniref:hypothetical protein n=1 Tax=Methanobrevibacter arboriphilus TaxID=39441 RepID=UPI001301A15E|nr:hypothetical protein [Methanobrevibacter arboriphilus]